MTSAKISTDINQIVDQFTSAAVNVASVEDEERSYKKERGKQEIADQQSNREMREKFATLLFWFMVGWSFFVAIVTFLDGFQAKGFHLDAMVISTLFGSTAVSVIGLMVIILKGLFKSN